MCPSIDTPAHSTGHAEGRENQVQRGGKNVDYYEISMKQFAQQILPAGLPA
jgi:hypothetical protein